MKRNWWHDGNKGLFAILGILILVICGLVGGIVFAYLNKNNDIGGSNEGSQHVRLADKMEGWNGRIDPSTQALILSEDIQEKMENNENYNVSNALNDYEYAYNNSSNNLKFNVAIVYAYFVYEQTKDLEKAVNIMKDVEGLTNLNEGLNSIYYYNTLYTLYDMGGNKEQAEKYKQLLEQAEKEQEEEA